MQNQKLLSLGIGAVAVAAIAAGSLAFNSGSDSSASALGLSDAQVNQIAVNVAATPEEDREAYIAKLAANLGVDVAKLKEAIAQTNTQTIDEQVAAGSLSQERADALKERIANSETFFGVGGRGGPGGRHGRPGGFGMGVEHEALATFLGIDAATLRTEMQTKSLATIASEHGKSRDELKAFLTAQVKERLAEAVAAGRMTQEEADKKAAECTERLDEQIDEVHSGRGSKGMHGDGRWSQDDSGSDATD